ncbi:hypothetical protein ABG768_016906, partial [Culter alburnus]
EKWLSATVIERKGPVSYLVQDGQRRRTVNVDHSLPGNVAEGSPLHGVLEIPNPVVNVDDIGAMNIPSASDPPCQFLSQRLLEMQRTVLQEV